VCGPAQKKKVTVDVFAVSRKTVSMTRATSASRESSMSTGSRSIRPYRASSLVRRDETQIRQLADGGEKGRSQDVADLAHGGDAHGSSGSSASRLPETRRTTCRALSSGKIIRIHPALAENAEVETGDDIFRAARGLGTS